MSHRKEEEIKLTIAAHLGTMSELFEGHRIEEKDIENANETHFLINVEDGKTLDFCGISEVKYADVGSGDEGFTVIERLSSGRDSKMEAPFNVFKNKDRHYPVRKMSADVDGVVIVLRRRDDWRNFYASLAL